MSEIPESGTESTEENSDSASTDREDFIKNARPSEVLSELRKKQPNLDSEQTKASEKSKSVVQVSHLFDSNSFLLFEPLSGEIDFLSDQASSGKRLLTGVGTINNRTIAALVFPETESEGLRPGSGRQAARLVQRVRHYQIPLLVIVNPGGLTSPVELKGLDEWGEAFDALVEARRELPVIGLFTGRTKNVNSFMAPLVDFVLTEEGAEFLPDDFSASAEKSQNTVSAGTNFCDIVASDEDKLMEKAIEMLNYLPDNDKEVPFQLSGEAPALSTPLAELVPVDKSKPYEIKKVIRGLFDGDSFLELQPNFARNVVTGFARLAGRAVALVANQPDYLAGGITPSAARKISRLIKRAKKSQLPLIRLVDQPGLIPGEREEIVPFSGLGELVEGFHYYSSPILTVVLRKAYNLSFPVLARRQEPADLVLAWPEAEIAPADFQSTTERFESTDFYQYGDPWEAARCGLIDDVIYPRETRDKLIEFLSFRPPTAN